MNTPQNNINNIPPNHKKVSSNLSAINKYNSLVRQSMQQPMQQSIQQSMQQPKQDVSSVLQLKNALIAQQIENKRLLLLLQQNQNIKQNQQPQQKQLIQQTSQEYDGEDLSFLDSDNSSVYSNDSDIQMNSLMQYQSNYNSKKNNKGIGLTPSYPNEKGNNKSKKTREDVIQEEIDQDDINNHLMSRLNSELEVKQGNNKKKKQTVIKPFNDNGPGFFHDFDNQIKDFKGCSLRK